MDPIETQLEEIRTRYLSGNLLSPAQAMTRKHVAFLINRLLATEAEAVRLLGILQKARFGEIRNAEVRLNQIRWKATEALDLTEMLGG